jgi:hypothetical protein
MIDNRLIKVNQMGRKAPLLDHWDGLTGWLKISKSYYLLPGPSGGPFTREDLSGRPGLVRVSSHFVSVLTKSSTPVMGHWRRQTLRSELAISLRF